MKIDIQAHGVALTGGLRGHVEHQLGFALSQFRQRVRGVVVGLSDINGPKSGIDRRCNLQVRLNGLPDIVVEETETELSIAADRAKRTLVAACGVCAPTSMIGLREVMMCSRLNEHRFAARAVSAPREVRARTWLIPGAAVSDIPGLFTWAEIALPPRLWGQFPMATEAGKRLAGEAMTRIEPAAPALKQTGRPMDVGALRRIAGQRGERPRCRAGIAPRRFGLQPLRAEGEDGGGPRRATPDRLDAPALRSRIRGGGIGNLHGQNDSGCRQGPRDAVNAKQQIN